ncbi:MAG: hypothetical protein JJ891_06820 [Rhizobiaceae bacterium]|nr:hypothetical protein [Rhizobiaceae bacterium]
MSNLREAGSGWHFDKTIPVVTILGFVAQLALVAYWVGGQSQRLDQIEVSQQINSKAVQKVDKIEVKMEGMMRILERLERKIDE